MPPKTNVRATIAHQPCWGVFSSALHTPAAVATLVSACSWPTRTTAERGWDYSWAALLCVLLQKKVTFFGFWVRCGGRWAGLGIAGFAPSICCWSTCICSLSRTLIHWLCFFLFAITYFLSLSGYDSVVAPLVYVSNKGAVALWVLFLVFGTSDTGPLPHIMCTHTNAHTHTRSSWGSTHTCLNAFMTDFFVYLHHVNTQVSFVWKYVGVEVWSLDSYVCSPE